MDQGADHATGRAAVVTAVGSLPIVTCSSMQAVEAPLLFASPL